MLVQIVKSFVCSVDDGAHDLVPGMTFNVPDRLIEMLERDGYVRTISAPSQKAQAEFEGISVEEAPSAQHEKPPEPAYTSRAGSRRTSKPR